MAAAYRHFDNPAGARFKVGRVRPAAPDPDMLHPSGPGLFGGRSVMGVREIACLWHPPGAGDETPLVERSGTRALLPSAKGVRGGALVGDTTAGKPRPIRFPDDLLRRHHLYVARTRMGKSTLMHHVAAHKMREKAEGRDGDAIVVIDPHTDLVDGILEHVPESLIDRVRLINLSDRSRSPGINLLDTSIFSDRDRTADSVVRVAKGLWDQWGPRMQSILEQTVKTLHEANEQVEAERQYTILDGLRLLSIESFRKDVLKKVSDPYILEWWARDFGRWHAQYRAEALAPVQTRLSYYSSSKRARAILGQRRSTIDLRRTLHDGGVLLVSTSQGTVGRDVAALVGASLLNLVDAVIREQGSLPFEQRRGALVVVDEMQSMPGVDYESMLSELGKFGASFILATQSLAKLDDLSRTMRDTLLANVGCLAVFQVAGNDTRQLVWELGKERVTEDDITSLPVHQCYVRATVGTERMDAFSMKVKKPEEGDPATAERIRADALSYLTAAKDMAERDAGLQDLVDNTAGDGEAQEGPGPGDGGRRIPGGGPAQAAHQARPEPRSRPAAGDGRGAPGMRPVDGELLRLLADMPFLDRLDMVAVSGWSRGGVYRAVPRLEDAGLIASVPHGTELVTPTRRFHLTAAGLRRLAHARNASPVSSTGQALEDLLRHRPVSAQWQRSLMEGLDALASVYGVASTVSSLAFPIRFRWYRSIPLDAAMTLPDGRTVGIVRQGLTADRSGFAKRLWRLRDGPLPGALLVLMADGVRLRHARRLLSTTEIPALFALEREASLAKSGERIWSPAKVGAEIDLRYALDRVGPGGQLPIEPEPQRADPPADFAVEGPGWDIPDHMLPVLLKPIEKRALDLISDWPWIALKELAGLMGVSTQRVSHGVIPLEGFGLAARPRGAGGRLALTDRGLALLARRDRTSVAVARKRWSVTLEDAEGPFEWRNVTGRRTRQLLRNTEHTAAVHGFLAALAAQAPLLGWERRAVRPSTMSARLAPYLRYYSSHRPTDDHGTRPSVLVVFDDEIAQTHFLRVAREEMRAEGVTVPLWVSHREAIDALGPLGHAGRAPGEWNSPQALPPQ